MTNDLPSFQSSRVLVKEDASDATKLALFDEFLKVLADHETAAHSRIAQMQLLCQKAGIDYRK